MSNWNFTPERSISLPLASDARICSTDYVNDQIWELNTGNGEPPALSTQTTFGLRARTCRIFPMFLVDGEIVVDPAKFFRPITIHTYYPNFISLSFKPFSSINVDIEYWVPGSQVIAARSKITNTSRETHQVQLEWAELLIPSDEGKRMAIVKSGLTTVLSGQTSDIAPVLYLTGGVEAGNSPYPALNLSFELPPHEEYESRWVNASLEDINSSFLLAKEVINKNWEAEFARIQRLSARQLEIITGNHDWNSAFFLAQTYANQLIQNSPYFCKNPSFVYTRRPDQGYSIRKNGTDYNHLWNGQTAFDTYYLANFVLPASPDLMKGLIENFLTSQLPNGETDWKPGLAGQRSQLLGTPLLATLVWMVYQYIADVEYLKEVFPKLTRFYFSWFTDAHDRDKDLIPEWDQSIQTGYEEHPLFSHVHAWSQGVDIATVESPDLISYLYRDGQSLASIAELIGAEDTLQQLHLVIGKLKQMLDQSWSDEWACYLYRDRDSHFSSQGEFLGTQAGSGVMEIKREFEQPIRPLLLIKSTGERTHPLQVYIHGISPTGSHRVDHVPSNRIRWHLGIGFITSEYIYQAIEQIEITGVADDVQVLARSVDLTRMDQTLLLPLWAGIPDDDRAKILVNLTALNKNRFLAKYGLRPCVEDLSELELSDEYYGIHLPWLSLILEGLVHYGMQEKAAEVFSRWMKALLNSQKQGPVFYHEYHSETGKGMGMQNSLTGLAPIGLFLKILGIKIINPSHVEVMHANPFPWPVTVKYRGLTVVQQEKRAVIVFPDGQSVTVENDHPQVISIKGV